MRLWVLKKSMEREKGIKERTAYVHINNIYVECLWFFVFLFLDDIKISGHCMPRTHPTELVFHILQNAAPSTGDPLVTH